MIFNLVYMTIYIHTYILKTHYIKTIFENASIQRHYKDFFFIKRSPCLGAQGNRTSQIYASPSPLPSLPGALPPKPFSDFLKESRTPQPQTLLLAVSANASTGRIFEHFLKSQCSSTGTMERHCREYFLRKSFPIA